MGTSSNSIASLVLGVIGGIAWILPLVGYPVTIIGIILGITGHHQDKSGIAVAGIVLSIIFLIATIVNSVLGFMMATSAFK